MTRTNTTNTTATFAIGSIVAPKANADHEYSVCGNSVLQKAKVVATFPLNSKGNNMQIEILAHSNPAVIGKKYKVNSEYFTEYVEPVAAPAPTTDDYIWVDAFKGTDANMQCKGTQYEMNTEKKYRGKIALGSKGFHVCANLKDVFKTYDYDFKNRYFKVKALVRKSDYDNMNPNNTTLVAKAIKFVEEITDAPETLAAKRASMEA